MKEFKRTTLIKKSNIDPACFTQLFEYLAEIQGEPFMNETVLQNTISGYIANGDYYLLRAKEKSTSCYFINSGAVVCFYKDHKGGISVFNIFSQGQIALAPESFMTDKPSEYFMVALNDSHLLEIKQNDIKKSYKHYPSMERLVRLIIVHQCGKYLEKDSILRYKAKERVMVFGTLFPQIKLSGNKTKLLKHVLASFLGMTPQSLSRILKNHSDG